LAVAKKTAFAASCAETGEAWQRTQQDETPNAVIGRFEHPITATATCCRFGKRRSVCLTRGLCAKTLHPFDTVSGRIRLLLAALPALQAVWRTSSRSAVSLKPPAVALRCVEVCSHVPQGLLPVATRFVAGRWPDPSQAILPARTPAQACFV